jgi:hypothetical protein
MTQFVISGKPRRALKKVLSSLKSLSNGFWHFHQITKDIEGYDSGGSDYPMSDNAAQVRFDELSVKINAIEAMLKETV